MKSRPRVSRYPSAFFLAFLMTSSPVLAAWEAKPGTIKVLARKRPVPLSQPQRPFPPGILTALQADLVEDHEAFAVLQLPLPNASAAPQLLRREIGDVVQILDDFDILGFSSYPIDARLPEPAYPPPWRKQTHLPSPARDAFVLQFASPPRQAWIDELHAAGATVLDSVPYHGYVVLGDHAALQAVVDHLPVQQFRIHQPIHRASTAAREASGPFTDVVVSIANVSESADAVAFLAAWTLEQLTPPEPSGDRTIHRVTLATSALPQLAALPAVLWVDLRHTDVRPSGQREANLTIGDSLTTTSGILKPILADHRAWIADRNLQNYTSQVKMAILDTGFDNASGDGIPASFHPDFRKSDGSGTFIANVKKYTTEGSPGFNGDCTGHGTLVAGILAGNAGAPFSTQMRDCPAPCPDAQYLMGVGVVPEVPLVVGRVFNYLDSNPGPYGFTQQTLTPIISDLASQSVAITSNSWNGLANRSYDLETVALEKLVRSANQVNGGPPMAIYQSAGNVDDDQSSAFITWPAFAKNLISVGASENFSFSPSTYPDYPPRTGNFVEQDASDGNDIWVFSRQGPTQPAEDGRIKPDLVAPGSAMESPATRSAAFGTASCTVIPGNPNGTVFPAGAVIDATAGQGHLWSRGTSFAAPSAAGAGALLYTWFKNKNANVPPKPSLLKAMQITLARRLTGTGTGTPPDIKQGWGKVDLTGLSDSLSPTDPYEWANEDPTKIVTPAQRTAVLPAVGSGYRILNAAQPVRITVVWTDAPPALPVSRKLVNDLDLKVVVHGAGGYFALGNNFNAGTGRSNIFVSGVSSGAPDTKNNVEQAVFLASDVGNSSQFHLEVFGSLVADDGIGVWNRGPFQQDFSVFIQNAESYTNNAAVTGDSVSATTVPAGGPFQAVFTLQNTGTSVWTAAGSYKLVSIAGRAFGTELTLGPSDAITNPNSKTFTLNATAPYAPGTYALWWQMEETPVRFGNGTQSRLIEVTPTPRSFYTVTPCRVLDTRDAGMGGLLLNGLERVFSVSGTCGIPAGTAAVSANLTIVDPATGGHLLVYPANIPLPPVSTINFGAGQTRANNALVTLDAQGRIAAFAGANTHLVLDVNGYFQ